MRESADRAILVLLLVVHAGLLAWAAIGFAELLAPAVPWPRLSNPLFSPAMLLLQWTLVGGAALTFLLGWRNAWPRLRAAMAGWYAAMAATCAYQTVFVLEHDSRFLAMAVEYAEYALILAWLWRSPLVARRIGREHLEAA